MEADFDQTDWQNSQSDSLPFYLSLVPVEPEAPALTLHLREGSNLLGEGGTPLPQLEGSYRLVCTTEGIEVERLGQVALWRPGRLEQIPGYFVWVVPRVSPVVGSLELLEDEKTVRSWPVYAQPYRVGRGGLNARRNDLELPSSSVSRAHALLWVDENETLWLRAESAGSPSEVSSRRLEPLEVAQVPASAWLRLGRCTLRWQPARETRKQLSLYSLGRFQLVWGERVWSDADFKTEKLRWLLCLVAWPWGRSLSVEQLIELLWPDVSLLQGRKNLSRLVQQLREPNYLGEELDLVLLRTATTWQLNPRYLGRHDAAEVTALNERSSLEQLEQALDLYLGSYLEGCYEEWCVQRREQLEIDALGGCRRLAAGAQSGSHWKTLKKAAEVGLKLDPLCEQFCHQLITALRQLGYSQEAVLVYHSFARRYTDECGGQPQPSLREAAGVL